MKIAVIGYSGSGKSTLARTLGERYKVPVLHLDTVFHAANWQQRDRQEQLAAVETFLDGSDGWVIDGNYTDLLYRRRMEEADRIVMLLFGRFACLYRAAKRYRTYRGRSRPDVAAGCTEKLDWEFIRWILHGGRTRAARKRYRDLGKAYPGKTTVLKNQRQLDAFLAGGQRYG